jgi:hypothetical protein
MRRTFRTILPLFAALRHRRSPRPSDQISCGRAPAITGQTARRVKWDIRHPLTAGRARRGRIACYGDRPFIQFQSGERL